MKISIFKYKDLIKKLPVTEQCFAVKKDDWKKKLDDNHLLQLFNEKSNICISRNDLKNTTVSVLFVLKVVLWGYPKGMRGQNFGKIYKKIDELVKILDAPDRECLLLKDLPILQSKFRQISGLGLSTYSKLLYFGGFSFAGLPALILDERLIRVFNKEIFTEFSGLKSISQHNAGKMYLQYLELMDGLSKNMNTSADAIEQFLFIFGNHLKPIEN